MFGTRKHMIADEVIDAFYEGRRSGAYPLAVNDVVRVKQGTKSGAFAAVISVQSPAPAVSYLVEYGDGSDEIIPLAELERTEPIQPPLRNATITFAPTSESEVRRADRDRCP